MFEGKPAEWEDAVGILLQIEKVVADLGAHTALTGSCLYKGKSDKDIDIIIYPHATNDPYRKDEILQAIKDIGKLGVVNHKGWWYFQTTRPYVDKDVVIINFDGFRVDLFFLLL